MRRRAPHRGDPAVTVAAAGELTAETRGFLHRGWEQVDRDLFGADVDWTRRPSRV